MSSDPRTQTPRAAADAFYGQSEDAFAEQIKKMGATDPRLIQAFERTRKHYLQQKQN